MSLSRASPPNSSWNRRWKCAFTLSKASSRRLRPSRFRLEMPCLSRAMACSTSAFSRSSSSSFAESSASSSSARRLTPPSRSRSPLSLASLPSTSARAGRGLPSFTQASARQASGAQSSCSRMACAVSLRRSRDDSSSASALPAPRARRQVSPALRARPFRGASTRSSARARSSAALLRSRSAAAMASSSRPRRCSISAGRLASASRSTRVSASRARNVSICSRALAMRFRQSSSSALIASSAPGAGELHARSLAPRPRHGHSAERFSTASPWARSSAASSVSSAASARRPDAIRAKAAARLIEGNEGSALGLGKGAELLALGDALMLGLGDGVAGAAKLVACLAHLHAQRLGRFGS